MRVIVCGSRHWNDRVMVKQTLIEVGATEIIEGECVGADIISRSVGEELGISVVSVPANWDLFGLAAGPIRNSRMLTYKPDLVLAFHDYISQSKGTKDMVAKAKAQSVPVRIVSHTVLLAKTKES